LAPDIVQAIVDGRESTGLTLPRLLERWPVEWDGQRIQLAHPIEIR
jgi:hypothetical protein